MRSERSSRRRRGLRLLLACTLFIAGGGRGCNAFVAGVTRHQPAFCGGTARLRGSASDAVVPCLVRQHLQRRSAQLWAPLSHHLLNKRPRTALGRTALRQTRGEAKDSDRKNEGGRQGSGKRRQGSTGGTGGLSLINPEVTFVNPPGPAKLRAMYMCQLLAGFADRMWEFSIPFFLLALSRPDSAALAVFYALFAGIANVVSAPLVGYTVEKYPRLQAVTVCLIVQALLVITSFLSIRAALSLSASSAGSIAALVALLTLSSSGASVASLATTHAIERDWIRCLNRYEEEGIRVSGQMLRGIGIACRIAAPLSVGLVLAVCPMEAAAAWIAVWTIVNILIEWAILRVLYVTNASLASPKIKSKYDFDGAPSSGSGSSSKSRSPGGSLLSPTETLRRETGKSRWLSAYKASWREYLDVDGDGVVAKSQLSYAVRSGVMRCWDLWFGCLVGMSFFAYIKRLLAVSYL